MTVETCLRLAEHFRSLGKTEEADAYEARAKSKLERKKKYRKEEYNGLRTQLGVKNDKEEVVVDTPSKKPKQ